MSPFTVMQILWINLVMDILAAIALATEAPHPTKLSAVIEPDRRELQILPVMWRSIYTQVIYQFIVLTILLYFGPKMFNIPYSLIRTPLKTKDGVPTVRLQHYTFLFHTFLIMNTCNMLNSRVISTEFDKKLNVLERFWNNWYFPIVWLSILNFQYAIVSWPFLRGVFGCTPLTFQMHLASGFFGLGSFLVAFVVKFTPYTFA